jgi:putative hydrolase of the HAD superfamily
MTIEKGIRNIVFDLGGVLCGLSGERCISALQSVGADAIAHYVAEHKVEDLFLRAELGEISTHAFCDEVRHITGRALADESVVWAWNELLTGISDRRKSRLLELRGSYRLFLLSNTNDMHWHRCADDFFPFTAADGRRYLVGDYFEKVFLSYELHLAKPSEEIFRRVLADADIAAEQTLFIDDSPANCAAAASLGIHTFHNRNIDDWLL